MSGFPKETVTFLKGLGANNTKSWFDAHRADYETAYIGPAKVFIEAVAEPLRTLAPDIHAEPRVNGSIFRINRDIRFSKDKTPYKNHLDLWFWSGERKTAVSSFFFRLTAARLILGAGNHGFDRERQEAFRKAVAGKLGIALGDVVRTLEADSFAVGGAHYAHLPRGFEADSAEIERLLRFNALWATRETPHPPALHRADFVDHCIGT